jgi:hypothetical protein
VWHNVQTGDMFGSQMQEWLAENRAPVPLDEDRVIAAGIAAVWTAITILVSVLTFPHGG